MISCLLLHNLLLIFVLNQFGSVYNKNYENSWKDQKFPFVLFKFEFCLVWNFMILKIRAFPSFWSKISSNTVAHFCKLGSISSHNRFNSICVCQPTTNPKLLALSSFCLPNDKASALLLIIYRTLSHKAYKRFIAPQLSYLDKICRQFQCVHRNLTCPNLFTFFCYYLTFTFILFVYPIPWNSADRDLHKINRLHTPAEISRSATHRL